MEHSFQLEHKAEQLLLEANRALIIKIENEYGNIMSAYGAGGKAYINCCANMANSLDIGVSWIMCQQDDAHQSMGWGGKDPHRIAEDLAFAVASFFQTGGTLQNYYMEIWINQNMAI
ncbi:beta-galactosidase 15 isoform X2 [Jatropha curcas]|uniref:beta-galactosidase 15 isoform X2 n=1 Tax=Jatropha curcas TaxID=180498 RepID=UPI0009D6EC64|nr:beta-galactosidase 15 isoform X2 [Jatropha curcas]